MWPNPQFLVTFTEEIRNEKSIFAQCQDPAMKINMKNSVK